MSAIALNVLPIFVLIFIGWLAVRMLYLKAEVGDSLSDFVFKIAVPVLLFRTIAEADFSHGQPWLLWIAYFSGVAFTWTCGHMIAVLIFKRDPRVAVLAGVSSSFANTVFIGLPLVSRVVGDEGVVALSLLLSVHLPVMMIAGTITMERAQRKAGGHSARGLVLLLGAVVRNLARNPLVIGLLCGALFHLASLRPEGPFKVIVDQLAAVAAPAALISIGMALVKYGISGNVALAGTTSLLKLVVLPACVYGAALLLDLPRDWTLALVLTASVPTGVNAWLIASHFNAGHGLASSTITLTTLFGVLTVSGWAYILM